MNKTNDTIVGVPEVRAWDVPTRLFHWLLVLGIISGWVSFRYAEALGDPQMKWHRYNGYAILVLLVFRLLWGVFGSPTSRWRNFVTSPMAALRYGISLMSGRTLPHYLGHNPLGTYMVLALLTVVAAQAGTGLFVVEHNDTTWGPLYKLISEDAQKTIRYVHQNMFFVILLPLVALHIFANVLYGVVKKDPLVRAMIVGTKPDVEYVDAPASNARWRGIAVALPAMLAAIAAVFTAILALGGKLFY